MHVIVQRPNKYDLQHGPQLTLSRAHTLFVGTSCSGLLWHHLTLLLQQIPQPCFCGRPCVLICRPCPATCRGIHATRDSLCFFSSSCIRPCSSSRSSQRVAPSASAISTCSPRAIIMPARTAWPCSQTAPLVSAGAGVAAQHRLPTNMPATALHGPAGREGGVQLPACSMSTAGARGWRACLPGQGLQTGRGSWQGTAAV